MAASRPALLGTGAIYLVLAAAPLGVALVGHPLPGRGFAVEFAVGLGFVGFTMLALQFALTAKFRSISRLLGLDTLLHMHRQVGMIAYGFILAHLAILATSSPAYAAFLDPRVDLMRAAALWTVLLALTALIVTTLWRQELRIPYEWWRSGHGLLALLVLFIGLVHILRVGWYVSTGWKQAVWVGTALIAIGLLGYARVWKPLRLRARPWRVADVRPEAGRSWTLSLEPEGHAGMSFRPGQFVWLTLGPSPFSMDQHPFSVSSSAERKNRLDVTVKELGDYTRRIGEVEPGDRAFLDGPYGSFVLDADAEDIVLVAGGIGITPVMSILRTVRELGHPVPSLLLYGVPSEGEATFLDELRTMGGEEWLRLVPVVEEPTDPDAVEAGLIGPEVLEAHLPDDHPGIHYYVCGPEPMMDVVESFLHDRDVPLSRVHSERFNIA